MLTFNQASYSGVACGTITGAYVTATVNGSPASGQTITTTLSNGYTFADGTTSNTQVSGSDGRVNLPAISVPSQGGSGSLGAATSGASPASASVTSPGATSKLVGAAWNNTAYPALPAGVTASAVGYGAIPGANQAYFLGSDTYLYVSNNYGAWTKTSPAGVSSFSVSTTDSGAVYITGNGTGVGAGWNNGYFPALPAGVTATAIGYGTTSNSNAGYVLGSDTYLYMSIQGGAWTKCSPAGVTSFSVSTTDSGAVYITGNGTGVGAGWNNGYFPALPAGVTATAIGYGTTSNSNAGYVLGSDTYLYMSIQGGAWTKCSPAGVTSFSVSTTDSGAVYITGNGTGVGAGWNNGYFPALPAGVTATAIGYGTTSNSNQAYILGSDTYLYVSNQGGPWTKTSPAGVTSFSVSTTDSGAVYRLQSAC
ncbi:hypothetical protein [Microbacterium sp. RURRCA19A]|uniref:hypothetical protein n=1 Tax=Microbacterium sp. RURRCA19A TaxID=1907391 RepID=UPI000954814B|nr:hypothetical protein [Microbacterium sp. RURRCA19A]SIS00127.1 hypothetical protein SAMN05880568_2309 [Microbacterium sp. RURRCA19A]